MDVKELLAALPSDSEPQPETNWSDGRVQEILADLAARPAPTGSLHRLWTVSELSAQVALAYLAVWLKQWFSNAEAAQRNLMETNLRVALKLFHRLGYLRGAMTKLGQAAGNLPLLVPAQVAETLDRLHFDSPPMHYPLIREVVRNEMGSYAEDIFAGFEKRAFAAASVGQVHRARLKTGEEVAVKIQYPGIARTIDADFRNLAALTLPLRLTENWESAKAQFEEVRRMLNQETDYLQEAESTRRARELFRPEDGIVVPQVYPEYSRKRMITTEFIEGLHLPEFLAARPSQTLRDAFGTKIYAAWHRMYYAGSPHADIHPGNYLFLADGRLAIIDFGCVQNYGVKERELVRLGDRMSYEDPSLAKELVRQFCGVSENDPAFPDYLQMIEESRDWMAEPTNKPGAFDFGDPAHFQRGLDSLSRSVDKKLTRANTMCVYMNRSIFGLKAMLFRLGARIDVHEVMRRERLVGANQ